VKPLLFANWHAINRLFCSLIWMVALLLAMAILMHFVGTASACPTMRADRDAQVCAAGGRAVTSAPR
jgi:hypothetical protein